MKGLIILSVIMAVTTALPQFHRPLFTSLSGFGPGRYNAGAYKPSNDGRYSPDNSGAYNPNNGQYYPDNSGAYVHQENKYNHQDEKYKHQADRFGNGGSNHKDGQYNGANGGNGQYIGNSAGSSTFAGVGAGIKGGNQYRPAQPSKHPQHSYGNGNNNNGNSNANVNTPQDRNRGNGNSNDGVLNGGLNKGTFNSASDKYNNRNYRILKKVENVEQDGYHYLYETENGIEAEEQGKLANVGTDKEGMRARGFYTYTGPDKVVYTVRYNADENGFVPEGTHIPTPPPIPAAILRALEYQKSIGSL